MDGNGNKEKRIGVYICHCGGNISDHVDVERVREAVAEEFGVEAAKTAMFTCSDASQQEMIEDIRKLGLDAIVVASCSPKLHLLTFRGVAERAGLNPFQYVQVNIREQCSWPHSDRPAEATVKALGLVRGGIEKARLSEPLEPIRVTSVKRVLVVGAGVAGMRAAIEAAELGAEVFLVERSPFVGGMVSRLGEMYPSGRSGREVADALAGEVERRGNITLFTGAELTAKRGYIGNFEVTVTIRPRFVAGAGPFDGAIDACPVEVPDEGSYGLTTRKAIYTAYTGAYPRRPAIDMDACTRCGKCADAMPAHIDLDQRVETVDLNVGAIIATTGFDNYRPREGEYGYGADGVVTLPEFERMIDLAGGRLEHAGREVGSVAFIYCVGSRERPDGERPDGERPDGAHANTYCSRYCCNAAVHAAVRAHRAFPGLSAFHLYRDIRTYGKFELLFEEASRAGSVFVKYDAAGPPTVERDAGGLLVRARDLLTGGEEIEIPADLVVLVTGMVPRPNDGLTQLLRLPIGPDRFYNEIHPKLRPVETVIDGVYIGGSCQGPKNATEAIASSLSAVSKAASLLVKGYVDLQPFVATVIDERCSWCGECERACPYAAIEKTAADGREVATVVDMLCKGCGACLPVCPSDATQLKGYTDDQIMSMIDAFAREVADVG